MSTNRIGQVLSSAPDGLVVEISDVKVFEEHKQRLQVGRYLKIAEGNIDHVIAVISGVRAITKTVNDKPVWAFLLDCYAIGTLTKDGHFIRSGMLLPVPTEPVDVLDDDTLASIFEGGEAFTFPLGVLVLNRDVQFKIDGDRFFGKHVAIVGSTGAGKSCAVAKILHDVVGIADNSNKRIEQQNNAHIVIFDIHSEYEAAFRLAEEQQFTLNYLDVDTLALPYWLMNSEELESMFIESNEANSHNQVSQFKHAVILNKERHNPSVEDVTYDTPVYFSLAEVCNYIENMNKEVIGKLAAENCPKLADGTLVSDRGEHYFAAVQDFVPQSTAKDTKASNGPFHGEFNRFVSRLEAKRSDMRLRFLLDPTKEDGAPYVTADFENIIRQYLGYIDKANVSIVDLSGIPFEVRNIVISLVARLVFDFAFHYSKLCHEEDKLNDVPIMVVCEEAHQYVPQSDAVMYRASRQSIERIAKEGRKYGLSVMVVSQRPSEVAETIFAQCNNFVAMRLTNNNDQNYVKRLFPETSKGVADVLPNLGPGECVVVGDAVQVPAVVQLDLPKPEPQSQSVKIYKEWQEDWKDVTFGDVVKRWRKESETKE